MDDEQKAQYVAGPLGGVRRQAEGGLVVCSKESDHACGEVFLGRGLRRRGSAGEVFLGRGQQEKYSLEGGCRRGSNTAAVSWSSVTARSGFRNGRLVVLRNWEDRPDYYGRQA